VTFGSVDLGRCSSGCGGVHPLRCRRLIGLREQCSCSSGFGGMRCPDVAPLETWQRSVLLPQPHGLEGFRLIAEGLLANDQPAFQRGHERCPVAASVEPTCTGLAVHL